MHAVTGPAGFGLRVAGVVVAAATLGGCSAVGQVMVFTEPRDAEITVDGGAPSASPSTVKVDPGGIQRTKKVRITRAGYRTLEVDLIATQDLHYGWQFTAGCLAVAAPALSFGVPMAFGAGDLTTKAIGGGLVFLGAFTGIGAFAGSTQNYTFRPAYLYVLEPEPSPPTKRP